MAGREPAPAPDSRREQAIVMEFTRAYESGDVDALVALLTEDIAISMPPIPLEYQGRAVATRLFGAIFGSGRRIDLVPTRANGQPAFGAYLRPPPAPARGAASSSSRSPVTGSAPSRASMTACSHGSTCPNRSPADREPSSKTGQIAQRFA